MGGHVTQVAQPAHVCHEAIEMHEVHAQSGEMLFSLCVVSTLASS